MVGVIVAITVLTTASIVPYATAGGDPKIHFTHFDRNGGNLEDGICPESEKSIFYEVRGQTIVELADGPNAGNQLIAPHGTNKVTIVYDNDLTEIKTIIFNAPRNTVNINISALDATSVEINASKIFRASDACGADVPRGTVSSTVFTGF